ncbi:MAG: hypothetical protein IKE18_03805 [Oscillospiraceae bacterium]|nr:hypothetical protein [Oscillospiraceae bacterium]
MEVNIYVDTTIKAPSRGPGKSIYLIECPKHPDNVVKGFSKLQDTTEDALTLLTIIKALQRFTKKATISIFTKCNGVYHAINTGRCFTYKEDDWKNAKGQQIKNAELWDLLIENLARHEWSITQADHSFMEYMRTELKRWQ